MLISTATLDALRTSFEGQFKTFLAEAPSFTEPLVFDVGSSTKSNTFGWTEATDQMREWFGDRVITNAQARSYVLTNRKWEKTIGLDRDDIEDDNLGVFEGVALKGLAYAAKKQTDRQIISLMQTNPVTFANGDNVCYDGKAYFATDHTIGPDDSTYTIDNLDSLALDATNFLTAWSKMVSYQDGQGNSLGIMPTHLLVPPQLKKTALDIVAAALISTGGSNVLVNWVEVLVIPELSNDPTAWYLADLAKPLKPYIRQTRRATAFTSKDQLTDDNVFFQEKFLYGADNRMAFGTTFPALMLKSKP